MRENALAFGSLSMPLEEEGLILLLYVELFKGEDNPDCPRVFLLRNEIYILQSLWLAGFIVNLLYNIVEVNISVKIFLNSICKERVKQHKHQII